MFKNAESFNGDISSWDLSSCEDLSGMFQGASSFNRDISSWDVSSVKYFGDMFLGAKSFEQDLCWDIDYSAYSLSIENMFFGSAGTLLCAPSPAPTTEKKDKDSSNSNVLQVIGDGTTSYWTATKNLAKDLWEAVSAAPAGGS